MYNRNTYFFYCYSSPYNSFLISVKLLAQLIKTVIWAIALTWHPSYWYIWFCRPESFIIQQEIIFADHNYPHSADYADVIYTNTKNVLSTTNKMEKKSCFPCFYRFFKNSIDRTSTIKLLYFIFIFYHYWMKDFRLFCGKVS